MRNLSCLLKRGYMLLSERTDAEKIGFKGIPYFLGCEKATISQFRMSSGESMLISLEKFLRSKCIIEKDKKFIKLIGDKYFNQWSLYDIIADYMNDPRTSISKDTDGKNFYKVILSNLEKIGISEKDFIKYLCDDIYGYVDMRGFSSSLTALLK